MDRRQQKRLAKYHALTNAAEMIRGHVENGLSDSDIGVPIDIYRDECKKISDSMNARAAKITGLPEHGDSPKIHRF